MQCLLEQRDRFSKARVFFSDIVVEHRVREFPNTVVNNKGYISQRDLMK